MKKLIIVFILGVFFSGNAQDLSNWQIGLNINPFIFTRFSPDFIPQKKDNNYPNGFGFGITAEKNWNEHWGIKTGIEYTKQNEKYFYNDNSIDNRQFNLRFDYLKFPLTLQYYYSLKENLFLTFNQGVQYSTLSYFKTIDSDIFEISTYTSNYSEKIVYNDSSQNLFYNGNNHMYNESLFGIIGSFGVKCFITNRISLSSNLRYEYDLTDADKTYLKEVDGRPTHNFRMGLELGFQYNFSLKGCGYCEGQKH
jgi:hypothetical protein